MGKSPYNSTALFSIISIFSNIQLNAYPRMAIKTEQNNRFRQGSFTYLTSNIKRI